MDNTRSAIIEVLSRGLRKLRQSTKPVPIEFIFSQFGNTRTLKRVTADRIWQKQILERLVDDGAIKRTRDRGRDFYQIVDSGVIDHLTSDLKVIDSHAGIHSLVGPADPMVIYSRVVSATTASGLAGSPKTALPVLYEPSADETLPVPEVEPVAEEPEPPSKPKRTIVTGKWQQESYDATDIIAPHADVRPAEAVAAPEVPMVEYGRTVHDVGLDDIPAPIQEKAYEAILTRAEQAEPVPTPPKSEPRPLASDYKYLTDSERARMLLVEEMLIRLTYDEWYERTDLFPGKFSQNEAEWQRKVLSLMMDAGVIQRKGERRGTRYHGVHDQALKLYEDSEWLLKLVMPSVLGRKPPEEEEAPDSEDDLSEEEADEDAASSSPSDLPDPVELILRSLERQVENIADLDSRMSALDSKLDEILKLLRGGK